MSTTAVNEAVQLTPADRRPARIDGLHRRWQTWRWDAAILGGYVLAAVYVTIQLWQDPGRRVAPLYQGDPAQAQWFLAHAAHAFTHLENPFSTTLINMPDGVNLMANTSILGLAVPMIPVTLLFGPHVSFVALVTMGLAGTASGWYVMLSRHVVSSRWAAVVGGWFCGFAPAIISHANWHPNIISQFLVPFIVWRVLRLREPGRALRNGTILGLLVAYQAFINEEILLLTALACGVFLLAYGLQRRAELRQVWLPMLKGIGITGLVTGALLAYPLYYQFFGPYHYSGLDPATQTFTIDLAAFPAFATESLAGERVWREKPLLAPVYAEENAHFGWPLLVVLALAVTALWRNAVVRAGALTGLVFAVLGLGSELILRGESTGVPGPWAMLVKVPLLDSVVPTRFGLVVTTVAGVLLALSTQGLLDHTAGRGRPLAIRAGCAAALALALVPAAPTPLRTVEQPPVPRFIVDGGWRPYLTEGRTLVPVPIPSPELATGMRWAAAARVEFAIPRGYFLFPINGDDRGVGIQGASPRPTSSMLQEVAITGELPQITEINRRNAEADLQYWRAALVVLPVTEKRAEQLLLTVEQLLGPATRIDDVWIWDVREFHRS